MMMMMMMYIVSEVCLVEVHPSLKVSAAFIITSTRLHGTLSQKALVFIIAAART
jgi:hypothetical protein